MPAPPPDQDEHAEAAADRIASAFHEALRYPVGGEIVLRSEDRVGRIYAIGGRLAWVIASTIKPNLARRLAEQAGVDQADLHAVYEECKKTGRSFGEALVAWNLVDEDTLRDILGAQAAECLAEILSWPELQVMAVPSTRTYRANLTFDPREVVQHACRVRPEICNLADRLDAHLAAQAPSHEKYPNGAPPHIEEERHMALEKLLEEFRSVKGYKASGIMNYTGEMLAHDSLDGGIDLTLVGATFNDIFRSSHEVCQKIGLQACNEETIVTPLGQVILRCSGVDSKVHLHGIIIMSADGNQALAKMQLNKALPAAMDELG